MIYTNKQIYDYSLQLLKEFPQEKMREIILPARAGFYIQKNIQTLNTLGQEIEGARMEIGQRYGQFDEEQNAYILSNAEASTKAEEEYNDLMAATQDITLYMISWKDLKDASLSMSQYEALMFMLKDEEE